jgi:hypothetical protein
MSLYPNGQISYDEIIEAVYRSDPLKDWIRYREGFIFKLDPRVRLNKTERLEKDYREPWCIKNDKYSGTETSSFAIELLLMGEPIACHVLVSVDGYRAYLPQPEDCNGGKVKQNDYFVAKIWAEKEQGNLEDYMASYKLKI